MLTSIPCGDLELNVAHPQATPTLVPSPGLERRLAVRLNRIKASSAPSLQLAVHLHVHYLDTLEPLLARLEQCQSGLGGFDLWVSTDSSSKAELLTQQIQASCLMHQLGSLQVRICANRGRNLGPLLLDLWPELKRYGLLLHLHGKRSVESNLGHDWLQELLETLLPSAAEVEALRQHWAGDPYLGLVMPEPPALIRPYLNWGNNFEMARLLARQLDSRPLDRQSVLVFPAGMMFWCRPEALAPLAALAHQLDDLPPEPLPVDGSSLHAMERLVGHACEAASLRWRLMGRTDLKATGQTLKTDEADLSLWQPHQEEYLQATGLLAAQARLLSEQLTCIEQNFAHAQEQLQKADNEIRRLMAALIDRDQRLHSLQSSLIWRLTAPLRRLIRLWRRRESAPAGT